MYTVLLADDEHLIRDSIAHMIETEMDTAKVIGEAANGREAMVLVRKLLPDIVLTDIRMPVMDGLALIKNLHAAFPHIQTVILSGYSDFAYAHQALQCNVKDYVLKPIKPGALCAALQRCIDALAGGACPAKPPESPSQKILRFIRESFAQPVSLEQIAEEFNYSPKYISNLVKAETGSSFTEYILDLRIEYAVEKLTKSNLEIKEIALQTGYNDLQYFYRVFKKRTGLTPSQYRKK